MALKLRLAKPCTPNIVTYRRLLWGRTASLLLHHLLVVVLLLGRVVAMELVSIPTAKVAL